MDDQPRPAFKKLEQESEEIGVKLDDLQKQPLEERLQKSEESGVNLNDLPVLPFEKILSYLSLEEKIKCRAVSLK